MNASAQDDNPPSPQIVQLSSSTETTSQRIGTLLGIFRTLVERTLDNFSTNTPGKTDGGVLAAVDATLIRTLDRIDKIVEDDKIWHTPNVDQLIADRLEEIHHLQARAETERLKGLRFLNRPFNRYRAVISMNHGRFIAHLGNLDSPNTIKAYGDSIESAMDAFDALVSKEKGNT